MGKPCVTAILNAHNEGLLAKPSLASFQRCITDARSTGRSVEAIIILDQPDPVTREVVCNQAASDFLIIETNLGDAGRARNRAVENAEGTYVAFLDADDLWGINWLRRALEVAEQRRDEIIWHPEVCIFFGEEKRLFSHIDMESPEFQASGLAIENYWTALSFAERRIYEENPYPSSDINAGFGFEDWFWNMHTASRDIIHKIVPGTGHIIRRRPDSLSKQTALMGAVPRPNSYIQKLIDRPQSR